jgi:hypothetical protein
MLKTILEAAGLIRRAGATKPAARRARWRGRDGQWYWAAV